LKYANTNDGNVVADYLSPMHSGIHKNYKNQAEKWKSYNIFLRDSTKVYKTKPLIFLTRRMNYNFYRGGFITEMIFFHLKYNNFRHPKV